MNQDIAVLRSQLDALEAENEAGLRRLEAQQRDRDRLEVSYTSSAAFWTAVERYDEVVIAGYAALFDVPSRPQRAVDLVYLESIRPGTFTRALEGVSLGDNVVFVVGHAGQSLADTASKTLTVWQDDKGLAFRARVSRLDSRTSAIVAAIDDDGRLEASFKARLREGGDQWEPHASGAVFWRTLFDVELLRDVSLALTGPAAYPTAVRLERREMVR